MSTFNSHHLHSLRVVFLLSGLCLLWPSRCLAVTTCVEQINAWSCKLNTGEMIDLSPLSTGKVPAFEGQASGSNYYYQWDPVKTYECDSYQVSACQTDKQQYTFDIGDQATAKFVDDPSNGLYIHYTVPTGAGGRQCKVYLICGQMESKYEVIGEVGEKAYAMKMTSKHCCPVPFHTDGGGGGGLSPGSILLIIFFVTLLVYLIVGVVVNIFIRNQSGMDIIPNRNVWIMIPGLVKDGGLFIVNKARGRSGEGSYQNM